MKTRLSGVEKTIAAPSRLSIKLVGTSCLGKIDLLPSPEKEQFKYLGFDE